MRRRSATRVGTLVPGVPVVLTSATHGDGLEELLSFLPAGTTGALLGPSGTGKSTLINALLGRKHFATDDVRASDSKGRHTTSHRELVVFRRAGCLSIHPAFGKCSCGAAERECWRPLKISKNYSPAASSPIAGTKKNRDVRYGSDRQRHP